MVTYPPRLQPGGGDGAIGHRFVVQTIRRLTLTASAAIARCCSWPFAWIDSQLRIATRVDIDQFRGKVDHDQSSEDVMHDVAVDIGQTKITTSVAIGERLVVES